MENLLEKNNIDIENALLTKRDSVDSKRVGSGYVAFADYALEKFKNELTLQNSDIEGFDSVEIEFIDRDKFGADIAVKVPKLMKEYGIPVYTGEYVPKIVENIQNSKLTDSQIEKIEVAGIYINIKLNPLFLKELATDAILRAEGFGHSDVHRGRKIVLDYSSPNMAKHLHAGHVRSTIIGEVLAKIYESTGYTVHRLNYLNDWGGMGTIMEAYIRLSDKNALPKTDSENDLLYQIYLLTRKAEKSASTHEAETSFEESIAELKNLVGEFSDFNDYKNKYAEFVEASKERFRNLESGNKEEFELWQKMRDWSISEFEKFYNILNIHHDYLLGESFYAKKGADFVKEKLESGEVVLFTKELADIEIKKVQEAFEAETIKKSVLEKKLEEINNDIGAYLIILPSGDRMVIMRADGATIYATRDLVSAKHRLETFTPSRLVYEVGQEQNEHFKHLFEAVLLLNLNKGADVDLKHLSHGFYVDAETGQKLSSREGAQNVVSLVQESINYFRNKYDERSEGERAQDFTDEEKDKNAKLLAIGSIAFNDIRQDKRFSIPFHKDISKNIKNFEESGGAYIMYAIARANSIIRKSDKNISDIDLTALDFSGLENIEVGLIKKVADLPRIILKAGETDNPAVLAEYLHTLANDYSGYYENYEVLDSGKLLHPHRLIITKIIATALANGLKLCHAEAPERI